VLCQHCGSDILETLGLEVIYIMKFPGTVIFCDISGMLQEEWSLGGVRLVCCCVVKKMMDRGRESYRTNEAIVLSMW